MSVVNKAEVSKAIALIYESITVLIATVTMFFLCAAFSRPMGIMEILVSIATAFVDVVMLLTLMSLYRKTYILMDDATIQHENSIIQ